RRVDGEASLLRQRRGLGVEPASDDHGAVRPPQRLRVRQRIAGTAPYRRSGVGQETDRLRRGKQRLRAAVVMSFGHTAPPSLLALAERVSISRSNAYTRVERMIAEGVIAGFTARIDPVRAGLGTSAYVLLTIEQHSWREVAARLRDVPYIEHVAFVGGDVDLV